MQFCAKRCVTGIMFLCASMLCSMQKRYEHVIRISLLESIQRYNDYLPSLKHCSIKRRIEFFEDNSLTDLCELFGLPIECNKRMQQNISLDSASFCNKIITFLDQSTLSARLSSNRKRFYYIYKNEKNKYVCGICKIDFRHLNSANRHYTQEHLREQFICEKCNESFKRYHHLKEHKKTHTAQ